MLNEKENREHKNFEAAHHALPEDHFSHEHSHSINEDPVLRSLLSQYTEAAKRGRGVLIIVSLAALLLLVGVFNHRMSWLATQEYRALDINWPEKLKTPIEFENYTDTSEAFLDAINRISENSQPKFQKYLMHEVLDGAMKTVDVPILGVQIYIDDLPILGSIGLLILLIWFYYTRRRERGLIKMLRSKAVFANPKSKKQTVELIYTSIALNQVFNTIPELDTFEKRTKLKWPDKVLRSYVSILTVLPVFIILTVVVIDTLETYFMNTTYKIPNDKYILSRLENDPTRIAEKKRYSDILATWKSDSLHLRKPIVDTLYKIDLNLIKQWNFDFLSSMKTKPNDWQKKQQIEEHMMKYKDSILSLTNKYFDETTLIKYIRYNKVEFDKMMEHKHRGYHSLDVEIAYLRTGVPIALVILNIIVTCMIYLIAKSSDGHLRKIFREYNMYFKKSQFNFDKQPIAHVQLIVKHKMKNGEEVIPNAKVIAKKNYREEFTNKDGIAMFEYLQILGEETFEISYKGYKTIDDYKVFLEKIEGGKPKKTALYKLLRWLPFTERKLKKLRKQTIENQSEKFMVFLEKTTMAKSRKN